LQRIHPLQGLIRTQNQARHIPADMLNSCITAKE
jgi:hypothetical protein